MNLIRWAVVTATFTTSLLWSAAPATAEFFADLYLGAAFTEDDNHARVSVLTTSVTGTIEYDTSFTAGGRFGYWLGAVPWVGLALDVSYFKPASDTTIIPLSPLLMLRYPLLKTDRFPNGQLQPYVAAGPGVFISRVTDFDTAVDVGADVRGGVAWMLAKHIAVFAEYRFTHVSPEFHVDVSVLGRSFRTTTETTINTHHLLVGASYRF